MSQPAAIICVAYAASGESQTVNDLTQALKIWKGAPEDSSLLWIDLAISSQQLSGNPYTELTELAEAFELHPLAVEDTQEGHQRTKFERYGDSNFMVLRPASIAEGNAIELSELEIFIGRGYLITVHRESNIHGGTTAYTANGTGSSSSEATADSMPADRTQSTQSQSSHRSVRWEADKAFQQIKQDIEHDVTEIWQPDRGSRAAAYALLHRIIDAVVDSYSPMLDALEDEADDQEDLIFGGTPITSHEVYALSRGILDLDRAIKSLPIAMGALTEFSRRVPFPDEMMRNLRDVSDHVQGHVDRLERLRSIMHEVFSANSTLIAEHQGDQTKKISAWAGILFMPSLIAGMYGMNFEHMPELHWLLGYPFSFLLMFIGSGIMYAIFKYKDWV